MRLPIIFSLASAALIAVASPAAAGDVVTMRVTVSDLDLTDEADMAVLKTRIADAASEACGPADEWALTGTTASDCVSTLTRKAMAEAKSRIAELP